MGEQTKIEWCDHTLNPWRGCTKVSAGCANCYADAQSKRRPGVLGIWGKDGTRVVASEATWRDPLKWDRAAKAAGERHRVFCASMADVFEGPETMPIDSVDAVIAARRRLLMLIHDTPHLDWLLLTKRPQNIAESLAVVAERLRRAAQGDARHARPRSERGRPMTLVERLVNRLRHDAVIDIPSEYRFERTYAGRNMRSSGGWVWRMWFGNRTIGSTQTVRDLLRSKAISFGTSPLDADELFGEGTR